MQWIVGSEFSSDHLAIIAINNTADKPWLLNYVAQMGLLYPFIFDQQSELFDLYQVNATIGNAPPSYFIIDQEGIVRYRIDNTYEQFEAMKGIISDLLQ